MQTVTTGWTAGSHATIHGVSQPEVERRAPDAPAPVHRHVSRSADTLPERLSRHLVLYGVLLILLQLAFRGWALAGSWFYFDDIAFMSRAMNEPLDASYLLESYGGHLMPGGFLTAWLLTKVAVYSWAPWAAVLLVLQALAGFGMLRLLVSLFGRRPLVLALLAGYLAYVFTLSAGIWFAAGINQLPMQVALVFGLHAHVEYLRHRRIRSLVWAIAWTLAGLVFYEKTLLLLGIYAIVGFGWFCTGDTVHRLQHLWSHYRAGVLAYGALGVGYLALYVQYGLDFSPGNANTQPWSPIAYDLVGTTMLPGLIGGPLRWQPLSVGAFGDPTQVVVLLSWVAFVALVVHAQRTRTKSRRAWSLLAFTAVCNVVLLASARANVVGPDIAREYRYQTESGSPVRDRLGPGVPAPCRCPGAERRARDGGVGEPAVDRRDHGRDRGGGDALERPVCRPVAGPEPLGAVLRERAQHAREGAGQAGAPGRPGHPPDDALGLPLPRERLFARLPEPRRRDDLPAVVDRPALHLRRPGAALPRRHPGRPGRCSPGRAAATRSSTTPRRSRWTARSSAVAGGCECRYASPDPSTCTSRPATSSTT